MSAFRQWPEWICWQLSEQYRTTPGGHIRIFDATHLRREIQQQGFEFVGRGRCTCTACPLLVVEVPLLASRTGALVLRWYHKLLVWDLMAQPWLTRAIDGLLNPVMGKSIILYFTKPETAKAAFGDHAL